MPRPPLSSSPKAFHLVPGLGRTYGADGPVLLRNGVSFGRIARPFERQGLTCEGVSALNNMGTIDRLGKRINSGRRVHSAAKPTGIAMRAARCLYPCSERD